MKPVRTIKFVARQTGLSVHLIRMWEKRYQAVTPERASNNRRLYTEEDVERLRLLQEATMAGHGISQIARATLPELQRLMQDAGPARRATRGTKRAAGKAELLDGLLEQGIASIAEFDVRNFTKLLDRAAVELGSPAMLQNFITPLAAKVGELWRKGELAIAHEHFATNQITEFLADFARPYAENVSAPHLVLATPSGQMHELGAVIVAAAARSHGWRTTYLGAALPIEELVGALGNLKPRAVGLSIVYPPDDAALRRDLKKLRELLPSSCALLIGGASTIGYADLLREIGAIRIASLEELYPALEKLQAPGRGSAK